ncbi:MAG: response regulator [Gemmatimonadota bacterium]|nr:response regulator [Gemmatimonadota bacterium]
MTPNGSFPEPDSGPRPFSWSGEGEALLADDEPTVRHVAARALERLGLTVTPCANGREAIDHFQLDVARWRLIVLDLSMPVLSGEDALGLIRAIRADVPVLLYSGFGVDEVRERFASHAHVGFLQKPFTVRALSDAVRDLLGPPA